MFPLEFYGFLMKTSKSLLLFEENKTSKSWWKQGWVNFTRKMNPPRKSQKPPSISTLDYRPRVSARLGLFSYIHVCLRMYNICNNIIVITYWKCQSLILTHSSTIRALSYDWIVRTSSFQFLIVLYWDCIPQKYRINNRIVQYWPHRQPDSSRAMNSWLLPYW